MAFDLKKLVSGKKELHKQGEILSMPKKMPETIDFSELWKDPTEGSFLTTAATWAAGICSIILLVLKIMGH